MTDKFTQVINMRFQTVHYISRAIGGCTLLVALVGFCRQGSAEFFQFSTTTEIGAVVPAPMSISGNNTDFVTLTTAGNTKIEFTGLATSPPENLVATNGGTDIVFGLVNVLVVNATPLQNLTIPFTFHVQIVDYPTDTVTVPEGSGTFDISGVMSGTIGAGRKINLANIVINPVAPILIGGDLYTMNFNTIVPPGPYFPGAIGAHVEIVPEPSSIALFGLGVLAVATPALRRRRGLLRRVRNR